MKHHNSVGAAMKKLVFVALLVLVMAATASAATVGLAWDGVDNVTGYKVYLDGAFYKSVTETTATVEVVPGKHSFYVTAYNDWESEPSNTVSTTDLAKPPVNVRLIITIDVGVVTGGAQ